MKDEKTAGKKKENVTQALPGNCKREETVWKKAENEGFPL